MKVYEDQDEWGNIVYLVEIGGKLQNFPTKEAREKFLWRLWLDLLQKMLRSQLLQEALEWFWEQRQEEMKEKMEEEHFAILISLLLPWDNYFYYLPLSCSPNQAMARNLVGLAIDLILQIPPPAPTVAPRETFEEALARTRAAKAAKNGNNAPRG